MTKYEGENQILRWFSTLRPQLFDAPEFERFGHLMRYVSQRPMDKFISTVEIFEALVTLIPEQREFWLRAEATEHAQFYEALTAMFNQHNEEKAAE